VKAAKRLPDVAEVFAPGERGDRLAASNRTVGYLELEENLYAELVAVERKMSASGQ
jgi:LDH2 family malate/lactate/ureidoglycolate dehydrogenase